MRIALGQFNALVGDLAGNARKMEDIYAQAMQSNADLLVFPELAVCGYPPEDLLHKNHFVDENHLAIENLARQCPEKTIIAGFAEKIKNKIYNAAAVLQNGKITKTYHKGQLLNSGVFDERRYFSPGDKPLVANIAGLNIAVTICLDIWDIDWLGGFLGSADPIQMIVNISASPFHTGKKAKRQEVLAQCAKRFNCVVCYCNLVGGQDELVFDGRSTIVDCSGQITAKAKAFEEDLLIADVTVETKGNINVVVKSPLAAQLTDTLEEIYQALVLGTRDYARKNGFKKVLLGLSGGIDSSLAAAIAVDALGHENVTGLTMPSKFNSPDTIADAKRLAENLQIELLSIAIEAILEQFDGCLAAIAGWDKKGVAFENLQARIRGSILMSLSNQFGSLVLTTGNKSETAVGYTTLYGDTAGGFAVIKDVPKSLVYKLADYVNRKKNCEIIPRSVIARPPSAELRPGQKDSDSLPDYELLDKILKGYVEEDKSANDLIKAGLRKEVVLNVVRMVDKNEYKRRQSPPGIKITPKAFGKDRRLPITNRYISYGADNDKGK
jgi:NAD+ synthase (glutamine-hydrolysing)